MMKKTSVVTETKVPRDLQNALARSVVVERAWKDITPIARRDFITWIESAQQEETRLRRIEKACSVLAAGKRRPCCYAVVPMGLYKALATTPKAKAAWSTLSPSARRDFVSWVDEEKEPASHAKRIDKACEMLAQGKVHPLK